MLERLLIAAAVAALLTALSLVARYVWARYRRDVVHRLRADGASSAGARVLYFSTPYCVTCREMQEPTLERLAGLSRKPLAIEHVDALEQRELADRYRVMTVPTTAVFGEDGTLVGINYGYAPLTQLADQLGIELPESARNRYDI